MGDGSNRPADLACRNVRPFDEEFPFNVWGASVRDIKDRELGQTARAPRTIGVLPTHGVNHRMVWRNGPGIQRRNDHELIAVKHHRYGGSRKGGVVRLFNRSKFWHAEDVEVAALQVVDVVPVGLQEIGLIDARFLVVGT